MEDFAPVPAPSRLHGARLCTARTNFLRAQGFISLSFRPADGDRQPRALEQGQQHTQAAALEVARLRAAAKSAAAERDSLRHNLAAVVEQSKQLDRELQARLLQLGLL